MLVSYNGLKSKMNLQKLREKLPKLDWKLRADGARDTWCYFNNKYAEVERQVNDDCFLEYPLPICANLKLVDGKVTVTSFMWIEKTETGGFWRFVREEDGVVSLFTPGSYAEERYLRESGQSLAEWEVL